MKQRNLLKFCASLTLVFAAALFVVPTETSGGGKKTTDEVLIKKTFRDDDTWLIIVRGFPNKDLEGIARLESAKRAALLNAYYFARLNFDDTIAPDRDGTVVQWEVSRICAVVHYIIKKPGLKNRIRTQEVPRNENP